MSEEIWCPQCGSYKAGQTDGGKWACAKCDLEGPEKTFKGPWPDQTCKGCGEKFSKQQATFRFGNLIEQIKGGTITCPDCGAVHEAAKPMNISSQGGEGAKAAFGKLLKKGK